MRDSGESKSNFLAKSLLFQKPSPSAARFTHYHNTNASKTDICSRKLKILQYKSWFAIWQSGEAMLLHTFFLVLKDFTITLNHFFLVSEFVSMHKVNSKSPTLYNPIDQTTNWILLLLVMVIVIRSSIDQKKIGFGYCLI